MSTSGSPERPARGLPPERALERWSDPEAYAAMREFWDHRPTEPQMILPGSPTDPREEEYRRRRRPLEEALLDRLRSGELLATAIPAGADSGAARMLLDPEVFAYSTLRFEKEAIDRPHEARLSSVEIFKPPGIPRNVRTIPDWYFDENEPDSTTGQSASPNPEAEPRYAGFRQEAGYRRVWINGAEFALNHMQAQVVKVLHDAQLGGEPWQHGKQVLSIAGSSETRLFQVFRREPRWSLLIESDRRGRYRLNIRE